MSKLRLFYSLLIITVLCAAFFYFMTENSLKSKKAAYDSVAEALAEDSKKLFEGYLQESTASRRNLGTGLFSAFSHMVPDWSYCRNHPGLRLDSEVLQSSVRLFTKSEEITEAEYRLLINAIGTML